MWNQLKTYTEYLVSTFCEFFSYKMCPFSFKRRKCNDNFMGYMWSKCGGLKALPSITWTHHFITIKTTSFTPPSVIKLYLLFVYAFTCFGFLVNRLQKAHQLCKGNYHYMIHITSNWFPQIFMYRLKCDMWGNNKILIV
jgi:hypothetical protein